MLGAALLAILAGGIAFNTAAGIAYLPLVGPPPLRWTGGLNGTPTRTQHTNSLGRSSINDILSLSFAEAPPERLGNWVFVMPETNPPVVMSAGRPAPDTATPEPPANYAPADERAILNPVVLAEFFKPTSGANTNRPEIKVLLPTESLFTPPRPKTATPSQASYRSP